MLLTLSAAPCGARRVRQWSRYLRFRFWNIRHQAHLSGNGSMEEDTMNGLIYLIGLIVVIMAILSFFGLR